MTSLLAVQRKDASALGEGLGAWLRGEDSYEAEAAGVVVAETVLHARAWLKAQFKGG